MSTERGGGAKQSLSLKSEGVGGEAPGTGELKPSGKALSKGREEVVTGETGEGGYKVSAAFVSGGEPSPPSLQPASTATEGSVAAKESLAAESFTTRQVIAVSASKGPAAFFNLARKFLVTDDMCDLSALEGAIVSAVDAAHLLERSRLASIVRVQTSYVAVEPKRKKHIAGEIAGTIEGQRAYDIGEAGHEGSSVDVMAAPSPTATPAHFPMVPSMEQATVATLPFEPQGEFSRSRKSQQGRGKGSPLRRARIIITVKRTEEYKLWLQENPLQIAIAGDTEEIEGVPRGEISRRGLGQKHPT